MPGSRKSLYSPFSSVIVDASITTSSFLSTAPELYIWAVTNTPSSNSELPATVMIQLTIEFSWVPMTLIAGFKSHFPLVPAFTMDFDAMKSKVSSVISPSFISKP